MRRTRVLQMASFREYCHLLRQPNNDELPHFINAITTNLTRFFREEHHFNHLRNVFLPEHIEQHSQKKKLRIWSSACSTGEEAYSIAISVAEAMSEYLPYWDVKILATDLDSEVLQKAISGVYTPDRVNDLTQAIQQKWFIRSDVSKKRVAVKQALQDMITFKSLNLLSDWPMRGSFDVIFCRNVLIYFDKDTQITLLTRMINILRPGGLLMLGHSESVAKFFPELTPLGRTIYQKQMEAP